MHVLRPRAQEGHAHSVHNNTN